MQALESTRTAVLEPPRSRMPASIDAQRKQKLGQFLTPESIGAFMASLFAMHPSAIRLLDAGAGDGALIAAFVKAMGEHRCRPRRISVTAYEIDCSILPALERTLKACRAACERSGIQFTGKDLPRRKEGAVYDAHEIQRSPSKRWRKATEFPRILSGHTQARTGRSRSNHCGLPIHQFRKVEDYVAAQETGRAPAITGCNGKESQRESTALVAARLTQRPDCQAFCRATKINPKLQLTHFL